MINESAPEPAPEPGRPRDHREIGREMGVFAGHPVVGSGLPLWLPSGAIIRRELEQFAYEVAARTGCESVYSPVLAKRELFETSGHWAKFADDMFPPMPVGGDHASEHLVLRPANCPHHAMIFAAQQHSYRDLPRRYNELAPMFRSERSGVLAGLSRVRQINLDDTHVFCRPDQIGDEVELALNAIIDAFDVLGIRIKYLRLSRSDGSDAFLGSAEQWQDAEDQLRAVLVKAQIAHPELEVREAAGEAAFYGPKIDVQVDDARGHEETLSTVQLDFNQPERLGLEYVAADGSRQRVIMIHRGLIGAMERMIAFLLEIHNGRLPLWLAPVQLSLLPVAPIHHEQVHMVADRLRRAGVRARVEDDGTLGNRIRSCRLRRDAMIGVIGDAEIERDAIAVQIPPHGARRTVAVDDLAEQISEAARQRRRDIAGPQ